MKKQIIQMQVEQADGKMVAVATDESIDREGDKLDITKWDINNYLRNPVLQAGHSYMPQNTIGIAKNVRIEMDRKRLVFEPYFHNITEVARDIGKMYKEGILKTFSVGFISKYKRDDSGELIRESGWPVIDKYELLEISAVPVPANANAEIVERSIKECEDKANAVTKDQLKEVKKWLGTEITLPEPEKSRAVLDSLLHYAKESRKYYDGKELKEKNIDKILKAVAELEALTRISTKAKDKRTITKGETLTIYTERVKSNAAHYEAQLLRGALKHIARQTNRALNKSNNCK